MGLAAYGKPVFHDNLRRAIRVTSGGGFELDPIEWSTFVKKRTGEGWEPQHADLAMSVQVRLEEVLLELAGWIHERTGDDALVMAGGVALNCLANSRISREGPFRSLWVQPAAGDAGTALGAALAVARELGDDLRPMPTAALGPEWTDEEIEDALIRAELGFERPTDVADAAAELIANDGIVAWFQGRAEYGPRALGHRSLLADPRNADNLERLNEVKGREQFRPVAPMVLAERAAAIFDGPLPSPYMLFTHDVRREWRDRIPAATHVDGSARIQTVDRRDEPLVTRMLEAFERRTGVPVVINTSLNTVGRPIVNSPHDALEVFGSAPVTALAMGPFLVRRERLFDRLAA